MPKRFLLDKFDEEAIIHTYFRQRDESRSPTIYGSSADPQRSANGFTLRMGGGGYQVEVNLKTLEANVLDERFGSVCFSSQNSRREGQMN